MIQYKTAIQNSCMLREQVMVLREDADMIRKVHRILRKGKNVEIKQEADGKLKVFKVTKELE